MSKLNLYRVLKDHFVSQITSFWDWIWFLILPLVLSIWISKSEIFMTSEIVEIVIAALSIFVGLLLNMIVLLFDIMNRETTRTLKIELLQEVLANICFTIFLSLISILVVLPTLLDSTHKCMLYIFNGASYFCLSLFILNIIMILKRVYLLFFDEGEVAKNSGGRNA